MRVPTTKESAKLLNGLIKKSTQSLRPKRPLVLLAVWCLLALAILDRFPHSFLHPKISPDLQPLVGQKTTLEGIVTEAVERTEFGARVVVDGKILLSFPFVPDLERGDRVRFQTRLKLPKRYQNPGAFDYRRYLERQGILLTGFVGESGKMEILVRSHPRGVTIDRLRKGITGLLRRSLPPSEAGFLNALLVGDRSGIDPEIWDHFQRTGTVHLIAISGQHLGIVGLVFFALFLWILKRSERLMLTLSVKKTSLLLSLIPVIFYTRLAGSPPSAQRAMILAVFIALVPFVRREVDWLSALAVAAIGISLFDPSAPFSASFQLSFLAVLGIFFFRRKGGGMSEGFGEQGGDPPQVGGQTRAKPGDIPPPSLHKIFNYLRQAFWMTLGATLFTAPLVAYQFHRISLSGIITNLWAIPFVGFLLIFAFGSLFISLIFPPIGSPLIFLLGKTTALFLFAIALSSRFSWVISFYPTETEFFLSMTAVFLLAFLLVRPQRWRMALAGIALLGGIWILFSVWPVEKSLEVTFLDVGQGDSALLVTPSGKTLLIDAGGFLIPGAEPPRFDMGREVVVPYLKRRGIKKIDAILLSHPHPDHYGGLAEVVRTFPIGEFWWNGQTFPHESFDELLRLLQEKGTTKTLLREGDHFTWEGIGVEVFYPREVLRSRNINDNSLVVRLSQGEARFLFTGDIEKVGEETLSVFQKGEIAATVLKIPHHASRTSSSVPFIDAVRPEYAVASLGDGNPFGFPHPGILEKYERRNVKVFRTDRHGAITFRVFQGFPKRPLSIRTFSSPE